MLYHHYEELPLGNKPTRVVTVGNFDGVHLGHRVVLSHARKVADEAGLELAVLSFDPHPVDFFRPDQPSLRLVTPKQKYELISQCGVDIILAQRFDAEFASLSGEEFAENILSKALGAKIVIVGDNFKFGKDRLGDLSLLKTMGVKLGFEVHGEELMQSENRYISSSRIRDCLLRGETNRAAAMLGRPHEITGEVIKGYGEGRKLGFPTLNLDKVNILLPLFGIYAATCSIEKETLKAAVYIGERPTLGHGVTLEAHLLDFHGEIYGRTVSLKLYDRLRGDEKFESVAQLVKQMSADVSKVRNILEALDD